MPVTAHDEKTLTFCAQDVVSAPSVAFQNAPYRLCNIVRDGNKELRINSTIGVS